MSGTGGARRRLALAAALALGALAALAALAPVLGVRWWERPQAPAGGGAGPVDGGPPGARPLLRALGGGLAALQERDGGFALWAREDRTAVGEPEAVRTAASALAAWALGAALAADPEGAGASVREAHGRALTYLLARQAGDERQGFGRLGPNPLGGVDRGPELTALCGGALALLATRDPAHAVAGGKAARALAAALREGAPEGGLRGLCALALDELLLLGRAGDLGRRPRELLPISEPPPEVDCGDLRLAEALVRVLRQAGGPRDPFPEAVLRACLTAAPPRWSGQGSDARSWLLASGLAGRLPGGADWYVEALRAIEDGATPAGLLPASVYADRVTMTACALLVVADALRGPR